VGSWERDQREGETGTMPDEEEENAKFFFLLHFFEAFSKVAFIYT
jgi:hypothetical protein